LGVENLQRFGRRYWLAFAIVGAFLALWSVAWSVRETRTTMMTVFLLQEMIVDVPLSPLKIMSAEPLREEVWLDVPGGRGRLPADVYRPLDGDQHGAVLIAVGAATKIRDHPGVIRIAKALGRAGVVVMVPGLYYPFRENTLPEQVEELVGAFSTNIEEVVASYRWLEQQPYVDSNRVGIFGVSAGGGIALVSAADERIRNDVDFFFAMGSYFDMVDLVSAITTGRIEYKGRMEEWETRVKSVRVLYSSLISFLSDEGDRDILRRIYLDGDESARAEVGRLTAAGREIFEAFERKDAERILAFWGEVSPEHVNTLREISPSAHVANLHTDLFIMTDRSDPYIPYVESRRLRDAAGANGNRIHYAEFDFFNHVEPTNPGNPLVFLADVVKLLYYAWLIMLRLM
jgi:dienelactone hydrolase